MRASDLYFESFWISFRILLGVRVNKLNLCSRKGGSSPERVRGSHFCNMCSHSRPDLSQDPLQRGFLMILTHLGLPNRVPTEALGRQEIGSWAPRLSLQQPCAPRGVLKAPKNACRTLFCGPQAPTEPPKGAHLMILGSMNLSSPAVMRRGPEITLFSRWGLPLRFICST